MGKEILISDSDSNSSEIQNICIKNKKRKILKNNINNSSIPGETADNVIQQTTCDSVNDTKIADDSSDNNHTELQEEFEPKNKESKLRIVPLEKLLARPSLVSNWTNVESSTRINNEKSRKKQKPNSLKNEKNVVKGRNLPQRKNRNSITIIELSDSDEFSEQEISSNCSENTTILNTGKKCNNTNKENSEKRSNLFEPSKKNNFDKQHIRRCVVRLKRINLSSKLSQNKNKENCKVKACLKTVSAKEQKHILKTNSNHRDRLNNSERMNLDENNGYSSPFSSNSNSNSSSLAALIAAAETATRPKQNHLNREEENGGLYYVNSDNEDENVNPAQKINSESNKNTEGCNSKDKNEDNDDGDDDDDDVNDDCVDDGNDDGDDEDHNKSEKSENSDGGDKSSGSEVITNRRKKVIKKRRNSDSDFEPNAKKATLRAESADSDDNEELNEKTTKKGKKRSRIVRNKDGSDDSDNGNKEKNKRKHIRKIIKTKDLNLSTKEAAKEEEDRRKRIEERQKLYNQIYEKPESVEVKELVLDFNEDTKERLLEVDKGLLKKLKPHQVSGVKFMWDACFETVDDAQEKHGSGCILAHCMGLGKTLQVVTLTHTLITHSEKTHVERVLIISPLSTLNNWAREFHLWISYARNRNIEVYDISRYKDKPTRIFKLNEWFEEGGVCILGYDMYRILANEKAKGLRKKQRETLQKTLVDPGPDLVICDEGHLLKNEKTSISKAVTKMRTKRRIVLTGTPLQNNLKEYYCMIQFVKPNLLGTYKEYLNRFVNPITNGQYTDSTERDIRLMKHRSHILHKLLEGCIQRRDYSVLAPYLPVKHEYVVYTTLSDLQQTLYEYYMDTQREISTNDLGGKGARLFQDFQDLRRIWTHPMNLRVNSDTVIRKRLLANDSDSMEDFICDDDEEGEDTDHSTSSSIRSIDSTKSFGSGAGVIGGGIMKKHKTRNAKNSNSLDSDDEPIIIAEKDDPSEWWKRYVSERELNNIHHSPKLVILMHLLQECEKLGDKLLVFSQSLQSLDVIEHFLKLIDSHTKGHEFEGDVGTFKGFWSVNQDYFRLDGSCSVENREAMCKKFNDVNNLKARLFLISTRAGGLGINLVAANRVVIFDVSWNPSHDTQSIFRVYRFGQEKPCYIYRLIAMGTMEQKVYERQVAKQATAKRVIDEQQISRHYNQSDLQELYTYELKPNVEREIPILPKDRLFAELLSEHVKLLFKYHEHDSLLENEESENLSEEDRKAAWSEYEAEKTRSTQTSQYMAYDRTAYGGNVMMGNNQYGNASGSVTSNKIFGFRSDVLLQLLNMKIQKDQPDLTQNQILQLVPAYLQTLYTQMNSNDPTMYKDLLGLHTTITHPSGMYMNPLLYANQNPQAAGYNQAGYQPPAVIDGPTVSAPGFEKDKVYEID